MSEADALLALTRDATEDESAQIKRLIRAGHRDLADRWPIEADEVDREDGDGLASLSPDVEGER